MKKNKEEFKKKWMQEFKRLGGGTKVDPEFTTSDPEALGRELQASFDKIFPELMKASKHRKHVIFDKDVFEFFEKLSGDNGQNFSAMINSALRSFVKERLSEVANQNDPVAELLSIRERERKLLKKIKELDLTKELREKLE